MIWPEFSASIFKARGHIISFEQQTTPQGCTCNIIFNNVPKKHFLESQPINSECSAEICNLRNPHSQPTFANILLENSRWKLRKIISCHLLLLPRGDARYTYGMYALVYLVGSYIFSVAVFCFQKRNLQLNQFLALTRALLHLEKFYDAKVVLNVQRQHHAKACFRKRIVCRFGFTRYPSQKKP